MMFESLLSYIARLLVWRFEPRVVAVAGSAGRDATHEAVYAVLAHHESRTHRMRVARSEMRAATRHRKVNIPLAYIKGFYWQEKEIDRRRVWHRVRFAGCILYAALRGICLMNRSRYPELFVMNYGPEERDEVKYAVGIARPQVTVMSALGDIPRHIEWWDSPEAFARDASKAVECLPSSGCAVLNADDEAALRMRERTRARVITYGFNKNADMRIVRFEYHAREGEAPGIALKLEYGGSVVPVLLYGVVGRRHAYAAAAAACVGAVFDLHLVEISDALSSCVWSEEGAMRTQTGIKESVVVSDTRCASPAEMNEALYAAREIAGTRSIAVLGDMPFLGKYSIEAHEAMGQIAAKKADMLITVGPRGKFIASAAIAAGLPRHKVYACDTSREAGITLQEQLRKGDTAVIAGSKEVGLDAVVEEVKKV